MLDTVPAVRRVGGCGTHDEAMELLTGSRYDIAVVPASSTDTELAELRDIGQRRDCKIIVLLQAPAEEALTRASIRHADGFLLESDLTATTLQDAIHRIGRGDIPIPGTLARELLSLAGRGVEVPEPAVALTPREQQTLDLLVDGCSNRQIADRLGISEHGAKRHVANVLAKLQCPNRTMAVSMAFQLGLARRTG
ncbi:response regulator transcription factor [Streptomyces sp. W16]|uniref:response regulator transcription factor n=1 Tax=Streptomyces sp. W16 TaxID=3076631 RepID=UPI00295AA6F4|nr:response regulator transcription factor [Streptomyces sp. W16]MDV9176247.1 response regulator transcription factor [Streptomyces sp. W16]